MAQITLDHVLRKLLNGEHVTVYMDDRDAPFLEKAFQEGHTITFKGMNCYISDLNRQVLDDCLEVELFVTDEERKEYKLKWTEGEIEPELVKDG